jgi:hypothetical protein
MIHNLSKVVTILAHFEAQEVILHEEIDAYNAPSECHDLVEKSCRKKFRTVRRQVEAIARRPWRIIQKELEKRGAGPSSRAYFKLVYLIVAKTSPFCQ